MTYIDDINDVPNLDAMSSQEIVAWLEEHDLSRELDLKLFPRTKLEDDLKDVGLTPEVITSQ